MVSRNRRWLIVAALAAVLTLGVRAVVVDAHGGDAAKVHSCVNTFTGLIRIIPANGSCTVIENPLDWGLSAGAGTAGPTGPSGPSGPTGAPGELRGVREYTSSGTFEVPAGVTRILVEAIGGGGGGGASNSVNEAGGGGAGGYVRAVVTVPAGGSCTVTVGPGGIGGTIGTFDGVDGGHSSIDCGSGALITAFGGGGGTDSDTGGLGRDGILPSSPAGQGILRSGTNGLGRLSVAGGVAMRGSLDVNAGDGGAGGFGSLVNGHPGLSGWVLIQW